MASNGTEFVIDIPVNDAGTLDAAQSLANLSVQLERANAAAEAAAASVMKGEAAYRAAEAAANSTSKALERINVAVEQQAAKLKAAQDAGDWTGAERAASKMAELSKRQSEAATKAEAAKAALAGEAAALDKLRAASAGAEQTQAKLAAAQDMAKKAADGQKKLNSSLAATGKVNEMAEAFGKLGGPVGAIGQKALGAAEGLKKMVASMGAAAGAAAIIAVVIAVVIGSVVAATAAIMKFAIANSDAARTSELLSAGIAKSAEGGAELSDSINQLSKRVPQSRDELRNMAAELAKTGLRGKELTAALESAAESAAEAKFGPNWRKQLTSLDKLSEKFKTNLGDLFQVNAGPLLDALGTIVDLFDSQSVTGKAIKVVFQDVFQRLADGLASLAPKIVAAFIQFEIWVLKALIAIKPWGSTIVTVAKVVGVALLSVVAIVATIVAAWVAVTAAVMGFAIGLGYVGVKIVGFIGDVLAFVGVLLTEPGRAFEMVKAKASEAFDWLASLDIAAIGAQLIQGLVDGITSGGSSVLSAMTGVVGGAVDAAKKALGIASPSKVFAEIGMQTAAGMAGGVESGTPAVSGAVDTMVAPPTVSAGGSASGTGGEGHVFQITINAGGGDPEAIGAAVERALTRILEGDVTKIEGGVSLA